MVAFVILLSLCIYLYYILVALYREHAIVPGIPEIMLEKEVEDTPLYSEVNEEQEIEENVVQTPKEDVRHDNTRFSTLDWNTVRNYFTQ